MTRNKRFYDSDDEDLQDALDNPNAKIHYNVDNTYSIEYVSPEPVTVNNPEPQSNEKLLEITFDIHEALLDYCEEELLPLLDYCQHVHVINLVNGITN